MYSSNRKFVVVTAEDVNKRKVTKVSEISNDQLFDFSKVVEYLKNDNRIDQPMNLLAETMQIFKLCLPTSYVKLHTIEEIRVLAVIGEVKLI